MYFAVAVVVFAVAFACVCAPHTIIAHKQILCPVGCSFTAESKRARESKVIVIVVNARNSLALACGAQTQLFGFLIPANECAQRILCLWQCLYVLNITYYIYWNYYFIFWFLLYFNFNFKCTILIKSSNCKVTGTGHLKVEHLERCILTGNKWMHLIFTFELVNKENCMFSMINTFFNLNIATSFRSLSLCVCVCLCLCVWVCEHV